MEEHEIACLREDLATSSPEGYTLEEMKTISEGMDASTAKVDAALKADSKPSNMSATPRAMFSSTTE